MSGTSKDFIFKVGVLITLIMILLAIWKLQRRQLIYYNGIRNELFYLQILQPDFHKMRGPVYIDPDVNAILIKLPQNGITFTLDPNMVEQDPEIADKRKLR